MYMARLHRYNPLLNCVVTFLDEHGLAEAAAVRVQQLVISLPAAAFPPCRWRFSPLPAVSLTKLRAPPFVIFHRLSPWFCCCDRTIEMTNLSNLPTRHLFDGGGRSTLRSPPAGTKASFANGRCFQNLLQTGTPKQHAGLLQHPCQSTFPPHVFNRGVLAEWPDHCSARALLIKTASYFSSRRFKRDTL